jgi:hypothetical protein
VWPYINASQVITFKKNKLPLLTFKYLEESTVLAIKLNFRKCGYCDDPRQSVEHLYT